MGGGQALMPWEERRAMSLRMEFVERAKKGERIASLCREFGISRTTGHKWQKRFEEKGYEGLEEESRRPKSAPLATGEELVMAVLEARDKRPRWGPRKLQELLRRRFGDQTPSERTIARILRRADRIRLRRARRRPNVVDRAPQVQAQRPNEVWTVDFKGWWRARDGQRCEPLTVRDAFSRYILAVQHCRPTTEAVRAVFERLFARHGVPGAIQCDNGTPFVSVRSRGGISQLSAWWLSLGIRLVRSRPGCPQDNGAHERMHADLSADQQSHPAASPQEQQREFDRWRQEFNHVRPHDALTGKTPADVYKPTERRKANARPYAYPRGQRVVRVQSHGFFRWCGSIYFVGTPLIGQQIGVEAIDTLHVRVWLRDIDLGIVEIEPAVSDSAYEHVQRPKKTRRTPSKAA
jgi:putative transposase